MVVDDVVLVFADDVHGGEDIECIIDAPLDILEIDFLANLLKSNNSIIRYSPLLYD